MIEILTIFFSFFSLLIFSNFPLNYFFIKKYQYILKLTYTEYLLLNLIINFNILLIFSFFPINLKIVFFLILIISLSFIIIFKNDFWKLFKENLPLNFFFLLVFYALSSVIVKNGYLEWDGLSHWLHKATVYFQGGGYSDLAGLPFDYYPHLGSYVWAFFWKNSYLQAEYFGRLFFIFIFLLSIISLYSKISNKFLVLEKLIIIFILVYLSTNIFLFGGYQEYFIFFIFFCFSNFFKKFFLEDKISNYYPELILISISNLILWIKQEGFFYFIILNIIFLIHAKRTILNKFVFLIFSLILISILIYIKNIYFGSLRFNHDIINPETFRNLDLYYLFFKIFIISKYFFISFIKYPIWLVILLSITVLKFNSKFFKNNKFIITYLILIFGFIYLIFLNTTEDVAWLAPLTLNRIVFAVSGFLIFVNIELFNLIKEK